MSFVVSGAEQSEAVSAAWFFGLPFHAQAYSSRLCPGGHILLSSLRASDLGRERGQASCVAHRCPRFSGSLLVSREHDPCSPVSSSPYPPKDVRYSFMFQELYILRNNTISHQLSFYTFQRTFVYIRSFSF